MKLSYGRLFDIRGRPVSAGLLWSVQTMVIIMVFDALFDTPKRVDYLGFTFVLMLIIGQGWAFLLRRHLDEMDTHAR